jgi:tRNA(Ile)-lysidine synthase
MSALIQRVEQIIASRGLFKGGEAAVVAVSGGLDSMVLMHVLHALAEKHRWKLVIAHFNHQLRGKEADGDERFVARVAKKLGLRFESAHADVKQFARERKLSMEMAARELRHQFLARTATTLRIRKVVLAHHADDQVELFFLRLFRGAGSQGLGGMEWTARSPASSKVRLVRPLLGETKSELADFAREQKIPFREDATNRSSDILRNRVRRKLLPLLRREFHPQIDGAVLRSMQLLRDEWDWVTMGAFHCLEDSSRADSFPELHVALQRRIMQIGLLRNGIAPRFDLVETLRAEPAQWVSVEPHLLCRRTAKGTIETREVSTIEFQTGEQTFDLHRRGGRTVFDGTKLSWRFASGSKIPRRSANTQFFDADAVGEEVVLRHWRAGDRFQPIGMARAVKLQDLFVNQKIPRERRHELVIAATRNGDIFWVEDLRIGERFKITPNTKRILKWRWQY